MNLNELTDEELALAYVGGNNKAFDLLLSRNEVKLFSYILFVVHDEDLANDIFQETFVKAITWLQTGQYNNHGKFTAWLIRIAHNIIIDGYRIQSARRFVDQGDRNDLSTLRSDDVMESFAEREIVKGQVLKDVKKLVDFLPANQREVVYMRFYQQMSFKEIAACTNVSINTSLGRMRYAILNLRRMAKEHNIYLEID
ncbi:MAG TPA: RNA polymerase subunit sigma-24 [Prevotella sp.]|nr:sigma-70 family RNA polymerase sigma factor [uncultured Prevotella sp.]HBF06151.1 RNA polymerase subunit sigma-24 [Candidatus Segatella violae]